jgi:DMSO/TMAO reductase YedYZ molybdopterin-dependent catalytic subunit/thiosulfate reductase cytochrome b subunit
MEQTLQIPTLVIIAHLINLFCLVILIRSGIQILYDHPKLYWTDDTDGENYWLKFGKKVMPKDKLWTSLDEAEDPGKLALPGGNHNLGSARHWHFTTAIIWVITGLIYIVHLFTTDSWRRIIPTDFGVFSRAIDVMYNYLTFNPPQESITYNPLQQITYVLVIFGLTPLMIVTGLALSPALVARFPKFLNLFGKRRQVARSLHFLGMTGFSLFILIHVTMALGFHFYDSIKRITLGSVDVDFAYALTLFLMALILLVVFNIWASLFTLNDQVKLRNKLVKFYTPVVRFLFGGLKSKQYYTKKDISPFFRVNGYPPKTSEYDKLIKEDFKGWKLKVSGLVDKELHLSLKDIQSMKRHTQITKHNCIQGWTAVAEWSGLQMSEIIKLCKPKPNARFVLFHCYDKDDKGRYYYAGLRTADMYDEQTMLAYEMNGKKLPIEYGAPIRLRCEKKYGYKMAKYIKSIEFVESFEKVGEGRGGYREDTVFFDWEASI